MVDCSNKQGAHGFSLSGFESAEVVFKVFQLLYAVVNKAKIVKEEVGVDLNTMRVLLKSQDLWVSHHKVPQMVPFQWTCVIFQSLFVCGTNIVGVCTLEEMV
jgi:hypothetical protein